MLPLGKCPNVWILDFDCSYLVCPHKKWFIDFVTNFTEDVYMGDDNVCFVKGKGTIKLKLNSGKVISLTEVRYVPNLKRHLISLCTLDDIGCSVVAKDGMMHVYRNDKLVLSGTKVNGLYVLNGNFCNNVSTALSVNANDDNSLLIWHLRLGHVKS